MNSYHREATVGLLVLVAAGLFVAGFAAFEAIQLAR